MIPRLDVTYSVRFYGQAERIDGKKGKGVWHGGSQVLAVAYDMPVPGHGTRTTANIRLWSAKPTTAFDLAAFNAGSYSAAVEASQAAETITSVLYPSDATENGKELRLKQQYLWCAASLADILRRFKKLEKPLAELPDYVAIQLNECVLGARPRPPVIPSRSPVPSLRVPPSTHPTLAIVE